jgi:hypothetical protein
VLVLTEGSALACSHRSGRVRTRAGQTFVRLAGWALLVEPDPDGCAIGGCANVGATIRPCLRTLTPRAGYSTLVRIGGHAVCLDTLTGGTDGTPPGAAHYLVTDAGHDFVRTGA